MEFKYFTDRGIEWAVTYYTGLLGVQRNGVKKFVKVEYETGVSYKLMKTKIKSAKGADGLYHWIVDCVEKDFCMALVRNVLEYVFFSMREAA